MKLASRIATAAALTLTALFNVACDNEPPYTLHSRIQIGDRVLPSCVARDGTVAQYVSIRANDSPYAYKMIPGILPPEPNIPSAPGAYIVVPAPFAARMSNLMMTYVIAHECAHHMLGHSEDSTYAGNDIKLMRVFEAEADCAAVGIMRAKYGMSDTEILQATEEFFRYLARQEDNDPTIHGDATERHARTLACF